MTKFWDRENLKNKTIEEIWDKYDEKHDRGELTVAELRNGCVRLLEGDNTGRFIINPYTRALIDGKEIVWFLPDFTWTHYDLVKDLKAKEARIKGY